jgi:heptosyltransferase-2
MKVLIVKIGAAGDVLRTTSLLPGLQAKYPKARIDWLTETANRDILLGNPHLGTVFCIDDLRESFRTRPYDLVINLDEEPDVCYLATQLKPKKLIGTYVDNGRVTYTQDAAPRFDMSRISHRGMTKADELKRKNRRTYQQMTYDILDLEYNNQRPHLHIPPKDHSFARKFAEAHGISENDYVIGISSSAGHKWPNKRLTIEETIELIKLLRKRKPKAYAACH